MEQHFALKEIIYSTEDKIATLLSFKAGLEMKQNELKFHDIFEV